MVKCNDCLREFPQQRQIYYQYCPWCDLFNAEVIGPVTSLNAIIKMGEMARQFPHMPMQRLGTIDNIKDFIANDEKFNPKHEPLD